MDVGYQHPQTEQSQRQTPRTVTWPSITNSLATSRAWGFEALTCFFFWGLPRRSTKKLQKLKSTRHSHYTFIGSNWTFTNLPFGICAIYVDLKVFRYGVQKSGVLSSTLKSDLLYLYFRTSLLRDWWRPPWCHVKYMSFRIFLRGNQSFSGWQRWPPSGGGNDYSLRLEAWWMYGCWYWTKTSNLDLIRPLIQTLKMEMTLSGFEAVLAF